jgi:hypothetical protein
MARSTARART